MTALFAAMALFLVSPQAKAQEGTFFEIPTLNEALAQPVGDLDLSTPQSSMEAFLEAASNENWADAAHVLNLNDIDPVNQAIVGSGLAEQLYTVLDRKVVISWQQLLERPDSLNTQAPSENVMAGQARKSLLLGVLELDNRPVVIRLNRVKPEDGDPVWVFSRQTVQNVPALFDAYGPTEFEKALPDWMRADSGLGLKWWELLAIPLTVLAAYVFSRIAWGLLTRASKSTGNRSWLPLSQILKGLRWPTTLVVVGATLQIATTQILVVSGIVNSIVDPIAIIFYVAAAMILAVSLIDVAIDFFFAVDVEDLSDPDARKERSRVTTLAAVRRLVIVLAVIVGTGLVLSTANIFQTLGFSLLASAGALSLVFGFAARDVLGNLLASMQISMNRTARIGDQLIFNDYLATVEDITFTHITLKSWDSKRVIVPVKTFVNEAFENWSIGGDGMTRTVMLEVAHDTDIDALEEAFRDAAKDDDRIVVDDLEMVVVDQSLIKSVVRLAIPVKKITDGWAVECGMRKKMIAYLQESQGSLIKSVNNLTVEAA
ncbi:mechanosensitive ion channel family protein [Yoonia litorea]|nr:mechanosensitive ion channel domain-containing protein [Yoonia litorea]